MSNKVFIATSLDGYIADRDGKIDYLNTVPIPEGDDMGFGDFMNSVDAMVMGRTTLDMVLSFGVEWPYPKPVFVLSRSMTEVPDSVKGKVEIMSGSPAEITATLKGKGYDDLYIDGGKVIQDFLAEDMIDEMIINTIPILLGGGTPLFGDLPAHYVFDHIKTEVKAEHMVMSQYKRKR